MTAAGDRAPREAGGRRSGVLDRTLCVAPMLDWTDRYCRRFHRLLNPRALLYTEMVAAPALLHGDPARLLAHDPGEHPVALQLGGSEAAELAACARLGEAWGYAEINLNLGCPSARVRAGRFGACLMADPGRVNECVAAMVEAVRIPVTLKQRIGIDQADDYDHLARFVDGIARAGCGVFIVHARKAWLQGLSPKENRDIPPLRYDRVQRLKGDFPRLEFVVNGGIGDLDQAVALLRGLDGIMLGRAAYHHPWLLAEAMPRLFGVPMPFARRTDAVRAFRPFMDRELAAGTPLSRMTRHLLGLFHGRPGGRRWRRILSTEAQPPGAGLEVVERALAQVSEESRL